MSKFLSETEILAMHTLLVKSFGGLDGTRDENGLQSAVFRPQNGYYNNVLEEACALMESLLFNHPFIDGNKRTAFAACAVFLKINGIAITAGSQQLYDMIIKWLAMPVKGRFAAMLKDLASVTRPMTT